MDKDLQSIQEVRDLLGQARQAQRALEVAPTVKALRERASEVVSAELLRLEAKTPGLTDRERQEVGRTVRRVVDKLLHVPTVQVKKLSGEPGGTSYAQALQRLFDLPLSTPQALYADTEIPADLMVGNRMGRMSGPADIEGILRPGTGGNRG